MQKKQYAAYLTDEKIRSIARDFREKISHESTLIVRPPVPIEEILDVYCGIDIIPHNGLMEKYEQDASISRDLGEIRIDNDIYCHQNKNRLRFSLAHELGHYCLHKHLFEAAKFDDIEGWIDFVNSDITDEDYKWIERQAYTFAGFFMVPRKDLIQKHEEIIETLSSNGLAAGSLSPVAMRAVAKQIGKHFEVSWGVIRGRGVKENLWQWEDFPM